jgi:hypothetical protein
MRYFRLKRTTIEPVGVVSQFAEAKPITFDCYCREARTGDKREPALNYAATCVKLVVTSR